MLAVLLYSEFHDSKVETPVTSLIVVAQPLAGGGLHSSFRAVHAVAVQVSSFSTDLRECAMQLVCIDVHDEAASAHMRLDHLPCFCLRTI